MYALRLIKTISKKQTCVRIYKKVYYLLIFEAMDLKICTLK